MGATAEADFEGDGTQWLGQRFDDAGRAEVRIDDKVVDVVDQYGPGRGLPFDWKRVGLGRGHHVLRITLTPKKSPESKDRYINLSGFEIVDTPAASQSQ